MADFRFPVDVDWLGGKRTVAMVEGKQPIGIATPPEFKGTHPEVWSPEDFLVAAAASCYAVTLDALAARAGVPLQAVSVHGEGVVGFREALPFGFKLVTLDVELQTEPGHEDAAAELAHKAEESCLVSLALSVPVELRLAVTTGEAAAAGV